MDLELRESTDGGGLGILHLGRLWSRCLRERHGMSNGHPTTNEWALDNVIYHGLNLPIEETIRYLYQAAPTLAEFENWVLERNGGVVHENVADRITAAVLGLISGETRDESTVQPFENI